MNNVVKLMDSLRIFIKSEKCLGPPDYKGIWECYVTDGELETWKYEFTRLEHPTSDEIKLMFIQNKDKFEKVDSVTY